MPRTVCTADPDTDLLCNDPGEGAQARTPKAWHMSGLPCHVAPPVCLAFTRSWSPPRGERVWGYAHTQCLNPRTHNSWNSQTPLGAMKSQQLPLSEAGQTPVPAQHPLTRLGMSPGLLGSKCSGCKVLTWGPPTEPQPPAAQGDTLGAPSSQHQSPRCGQ